MAVIGVSAVQTATVIDNRGKEPVPGQTDRIRIPDRLETLMSDNAYLWKSC